MVWCLQLLSNQLAVLSQRLREAEAQVGGHCRMQQARSQHIAVTMQLKLLKCSQHIAVTMQLKLLNLEW